LSVVLANPRKDDVPFHFEDRTTGGQVLESRLDDSSKRLAESHTLTSVDQPIVDLDQRTKGPVEVIEWSRLLYLGAGNDKILPKKPLLCIVIAPSILNTYDLDSVVRHPLEAKGSKASEGDHEKYHKRDNEEEDGKDNDGDGQRL
jgi:hypothetical protein